MSKSSLEFTWKRPLKLVMQAENNECGLACLTMIANYYGDKRALSELRQVLSHNTGGSSLKQLIGYASTLKLSTRAVTLDMEKLCDLQLPAIVHWDFNHFVVLTKVTKTRITIADPARGILKLNYEEASKHFTGVAMECRPAPDFSKINASTGLTIGYFFKNIRGLKRHIALLFSLSLLLQAVLIASPFYMQSVIDLVIVDNDLALLKVLAFGFALLMLFELSASYIRQKISLHFSSRLNLNLSQNVFSHLVRLPTTYFQTRHMGDIVSRFSSLQHIRELVTSGIVTVFIDGLMAVVTLIVMSIYSIKLSLIVLAVIVIYGLLRWATFAPVQRLNKESISAYANENAYFMQSIRAIRTIKLSAKEDQQSETWANKLTLALNKDIKIANWSINLGLANKGLFGIENLLVVFVAATLVMQNSMTLGMLFAFMSYKARFISAADGLINKFIEFKLLDIHLSRLFDIVGTQAEGIPHKTRQLNTKIAHITAINTKLIEINKLSFSYESAPENEAVPSQTNCLVLNELNLTMQAGECVAIVGASGCGKSTLLSCLLGLVKPSSGSITYFGRDMSIDNRSQHSIAAVLQEDQLLNGSILENISDFDTQIDIEKAVHSAQLACLHDDIMHMTMQYQSLIGDMGDSLSGGQRQRLILARALYKQPQILMLDEATSHLDPSTELRINKHLQALNISKIIIAHRDESVRHANRIMALSDGKLNDVTEHYFKQELSNHG